MQADAGTTGRDGVASPGTEANASIVPVPLRIEPALLLALSTDEEFAPGMSMTAFAVAGPIEFGVTASGESQLFLGYTRGQIAALAGVRPRWRWFELDVAGTFGIASVAHAGSLFSDDPGASGSVEFVGGRVGGMVPLFTSRRRELQLGISASLGYEHDLDEYVVNYRYLESDPWLTDDAYVVMRSQAIGGTDRFLLRIAFVLGLD